MDLGLVALAAQDFTPVILSGLAYVALARLSAGIDPDAGRLVRGGALLIVLGGLTKPTYKSTFALSSGELDLLVLDDTLFWLLAPGFLLAGAGLRAALRRDTGRAAARAWPAAMAAIVTVLGAATAASTTDGRAWFLLLLTVATAANCWVVAVLVRWARAHGDRTAAVLFAANLALVFVLAWAAASLPQTTPVQWGQQLTAMLAQGAFLYGALRLARAAAAAAPTTVATPAAAAP